MLAPTSALSWPPYPSVRKVPSPPVAQGKLALTYPTNPSPYPTNFSSSCQSLTFHRCPVPSQVPASIHVLPLSLLFSYQVQPPSCRFSVLRRARSLRPRHKERKPPKPLGYLCCFTVNPSYLEHFPGVFIHCPLPSTPSPFLCHSKFRTRPALKFSSLALS